MIEVVAVIIPVHNEAALLRACLRSVATATRRAHALGVMTSVHVVLDACSDASAEIAAAFAVEVLETDAQRVGFARQVGVTAALAAHPGLPHDRLWLAHTDSDSSVPPNWIIDQVERERAGADVYVGTVRPKMRDLSPRRREAWLRSHPRGPPNGHVHGANLGTRASTLLNAGGFADVAEHEDVEVVASARARGAVIVASADACVTTSGRLEGRTPGGYASYLRSELISLGEQQERVDEPA